MNHSLVYQIILICISTHVYMSKNSAGANVHHFTEIVNKYSYSYSHSRVAPVTVLIWSSDHATDLNKMDDTSVKIGKCIFCIDKI